MSYAHCLDCGIAATQLFRPPGAEVRVCGRCAELRERAWMEGSGEERVCVSCEKPIYKPLHRPSICSRPACQRWRHNRRRRLLPPQRECEYEECSNVVPSWKKSNARFCCDEHRIAHNNEMRFRPPRPNLPPLSDADVIGRVG